MKKIVLLSTMVAFLNVGMKAQVSNSIMEISEDTEYNFVPEYVSPDGKAFMELYRWDSFSGAEDGDLIDVYDSELNKIKSVPLKIEKLKLPSSPNDYYEIRTQKIHLGYDSSIECYLSQHLFNNDDLYEYIMPICELTTPEGETTQRCMETGFKIMSEDNTVLQTIKFERLFRYSGLNFYLHNLEGNNYLAVTDGDSQTYIYRITPSATSIPNVQAVMRLNVSPRMADRGETFTVELDGDGNTERTVTVTNAAGQAVWRQNVPAGQTQVKIGSERLSKGINVINVTGGKQKESCKVIVK